jgi:hypothetical protein
VPENAVVSVGCLWGRPRWRTCGIFVGQIHGYARVAGQQLSARAPRPRLFSDGDGGLPREFLGPVLVVSGARHDAVVGAAGAGAGAVVAEHLG